MRLIEALHSKVDIKDYAHKSNGNFSYIKKKKILCQDEKACELPQIITESQNVGGWKGPLWVI